MKKKNQMPPRWKIDGVQLQMLYDSFSRNPYPRREEISSLACLLSTTERNVRVFFQNRRQRMCKDVEVHLALLSFLLKKCSSSDAKECVHVAERLVRTLTRPNLDRLLHMLKDTYLVRSASLLSEQGVHGEEAVCVAETALLGSVAEMLGGTGVHELGTTNVAPCTTSPSAVVKET